MLIIGHGSRALEAQEEFMEFVNKVREKTSFPVEGSFMELAQPDFFEAAENLIEKGVSEVHVLPLFLFTGVHIKEDIPDIIKEASEKYEGIDFYFGSPIGPCDELVDVILKRSGCEYAL